MYIPKILSLEIMLRDLLLNLSQVFIMESLPRLVCCYKQYLLFLMNSGAYHFPTPNVKVVQSRQ